MMHEARRAAASSGTRRAVWFGAAACLATALCAPLGCGSTQRPDGGRGLLPVGAQAPEVTAVDQEGKRRSLSDERGHPVVVYFYPRDATPGCTREACSFRDTWKRFEADGVRVFGVSSDDRESHAKFAADHGLTFPLLADTEGVWARAFGVPSSLGMYSRVSFLIDARGTVARVYPEVDPGVHATQVLADAAALPR